MNPTIQDLLAQITVLEDGLRTPCSASVRVMSGSCHTARQRIIMGKRMSSG